MLRRFHSAGPVAVAALFLTYLGLTPEGAIRPDPPTKRSPSDFPAPNSAEQANSTPPTEPTSSGPMEVFRKVVEQMKNEYPDQYSELVYPAVATKAFTEAQKVQILESAVQQILTGEYLAHTRDFYGCGNNVAGLVDSEVVQWPKNFPQQVGEYKLLRMSEETAENLERHSPFLLIRLDRFLNQNDPWGPIEGIDLSFQGPIIAVISNYGRVIQGGCLVKFVPVLNGKTWTVQVKWANDP